MRELIEQICARQHLTQSQSRKVFARIVAGELNELEIAALLIALKAKGEEPEEIAGAAQAMRDSALAVDTCGLSIVDSCGTGGDGQATVNISTAAALVAAEAGLCVAKHGNRSVSSRCGSADVLERCGVRIDGDPAFARRCLDALNICFLFAPRYHPGVRHAMPVRKALGVRTVFNLLGPLSNPARPRFQLVGVYDPRLCAPLASTLGLLGCEVALVVHGAGLDEIGLHDSTRAALLRHGKVEEFSIEPEQVGFARAPLEALRGGAAEENAAWLVELLSGRGVEVHCHVVAFNAGALLWIAGQTETLRRGTEQALEVLRAGKAAERLERWIALSRAAGEGK